MIDLVHLIGTRAPRWVARHFPDILWRIPTSERILFFTFDDGPTPRMTPSLLDVLTRFDVPATFFLIGRNARRHPDLVRAMAEAGHTLGNHTYSHPDAWTAPPTNVLAELEQTTGLLEDLAQRPLRWMRPPYGRFTHTVRTWCQVRRQRCTMWDIGPGDYLPGASQAAIERRILSTVRPGSIIVLHDNPKARDVALPALTTVLGDLRADGWRFAAL